ncbi:MAG: hypothetical protein AB8B64_07090 [Granulosicoccus sp.]
MSYKTLLVCQSDKEEAEGLIPIALLVARQFNAHLFGIHSLQNIEFYTGVSMQISRRTTKSTSATNTGIC